MQPWREELAILKAHVAVQYMALRALVQSHPAPAAVLEEWRKLRADKVAAAYALYADDRASEWLTAQVHTFAEDWTAELADAATRRAPTQTAADGEGMEPATAP